jgi:hypothetical protein
VRPGTQVDLEYDGQASKRAEVVPEHAVGQQLIGSEMTSLATRSRVGQGGAGVLECGGRLLGGRRLSDGAAICHSENKR